MFASTFTPQRAVPSAASAYHRIGVETGTAAGSPHKLIQMLFDGFQDAVARARGALAARQVEVKGRAIGHASRILEEGLRAALDLRAGGNLAADLNELYVYVGTRLMHANLHNDDAALAESARLIETVRSAWIQIGPLVENRAQ
jgi:flagellar secretion chaperone FliS